MAHVVELRADILRQAFNLPLKARSGVPSALGHRGWWRTLRGLSQADQHGPVRKDTHQRSLRSFFFFSEDVSKGGQHKSLCLRSSSAITCAFSSVRAHRLSVAPRVDTPPPSMDHSFCLFVTSLLAHASLRIVQYFVCFWHLPADIPSILSPGRC